MNRALSKVNDSVDKLHESLLFIQLLELAAQGDKGSEPFHAGVIEAETRLRIAMATLDQAVLILRGEGAA